MNMCVCVSVRVHIPCDHIIIDRRHQQQNMPRTAIYKQFAAFFYFSIFFCVCCIKCQFFVYAFLFSSAAPPKCTTKFWIERCENVRYMHDRWLGGGSGRVGHETGARLLGCVCLVCERKVEWIWSQKERRNKNRFGGGFYVGIPGVYLVHFTHNNDI